MDKLIMCPFCGHDEYLDVNEQVIQEGMFGRVEYAITCDACGAIGPNEVKLDRAVTSWNARSESLPEVSQ